MQDTSTIQLLHWLFSSATPKSRLWNPTSLIWLYRSKHFRSQISEFTQMMFMKFHFPQEKWMLLKRMYFVVYGWWTMSLCYLEHNASYSQWWASARSCFLQKCTSELPEHLIVLLCTEHVSSQAKQTLSLWISYAGLRYVLMDLSLVFCQCSFVIYPQNLLWCSFILLIAMLAPKPPVWHTFHGFLLLFLKQD